VKGYELDDGRWVTVTEEDLEAVEPQKTRDIELLQFVDVDELDPVFYERAYFLTPDGGSPKAYSLLARIMEDQGRAGIATFVMRTKEYLVAILAENGILRAETLRFHDEVRDVAEIDLPDRPDTPGDRVESLRSAIRERTEDELDESALTDRYAERLRALVESKRAKGQDVRELEAAAPGGAEVIDLLEALKESLQGEEPSRAPRRPGEAGTPSEDRALTELTRDELYARAKQLDITGRSSMNKGELVEAIRKSA
jgi:DNA end-binding protein Ku